MFVRSLGRQAVSQLGSQSASHSTIDCARWTLFAHPSIHLHCCLYCTHTYPRPIKIALLRPGRFEVQIEVPPPKTVEQRISIIKVHTGSMFEAGRVLVSDAPSGTAAARRLEKEGSDGFLSYDQILNLLAVECDGMSGAMLAGIARAAASHALERAVCNFAEDDISSMLDCLVTQADFEKAIEDVLNSSGDRDWEGSNDADSDEKSAEVDKTSDEEAVEDDEFEMA